jgi:nuclear GTP-binding protein
VLKGGIPDKAAAARAVLKDWNGGKIPYFTVPPVVDDSHKNADAVVVKEFAPSFDAMDAAVLGTLQEAKDEMDFVQLDPSTKREHGEWNGFDEDEEMEESDD